jgi:hypothetical protein
VPSPMTTSQWNLAHGSRSRRAGMSVVIVFSSTADDILRPPLLARFAGHCRVPTQPAGRSTHRAEVCAEREVCRLLDAPEDSLHDLPGSTCHTAIVGQQVRGLPWTVAEQLGQAGQFPVVAGQGI